MEISDFHLVQKQSFPSSSNTNVRQKYGDRILAINQPFIYNDQLFST